VGTLLTIPAMPSSCLREFCALLPARSATRHAALTAEKSESISPGPLYLTTPAWIATAGLAGALVILCVARMHSDPAVLACCYFSAVGTVMAAIDIAVIRLPDFLTLPSYPITFIALAWASSSTGEVRPLYRGLEASVLLLVLFAVLNVAAGVGLGDAKLAGLVGMLLGYFGWIVLFRGLFVACMFGMAWAGLIRLRGRRATHIPMGPALVAGALFVVLA